MTAAALLVLLVTAELLAPPLAERILVARLGPCVVAEQLALDGPARPVLPQLLRGRAREVVVRAEGVELGDLRIDSLQVRLPEVDLPWGFGGRPQLPPGQLVASITVADARTFLHSITPFGLRPTLAFDAGEVVIGAPGLGLDARFVAVWDQEELALVPAIGSPDWWTALGLALSVELPDGVAPRSVDVGEQRAVLTADLDLAVLTDGQGSGCQTPVAAP